MFLVKFIKIWEILGKFINTMALDEIDRAILDELQANCRLTNQELSERVGLSASPCSRRVHMLEEAGVITGYAAKIDEKLVGLPVSVFMSVKLERQVDEALTTFEAAIQQCPEVVDCWLMTGNRDYLLRVVVAGLDEYEAFLMGTLTKIPGVASIESSFSLRRVKSSTAKARTANLKPLASGICLFVMAGLLFSPVAFAQGPQVPLPRKRPASLPSLLQVKSQGNVRRVPLAPVSNKLAAREDLASCFRSLRQRGVEFTRLEPFRTAKGCGIADPVKIQAIRQGNDVLRLPAKPVLSCKFAMRITSWFMDVSAPIVEKFAKAKLKAVTSGPGYVCRNRNGRSRGKLSEHAFGNALDITSFVLANGRRLPVLGRADGTATGRRILKALRTTSCGYFTTVLGPGANAAHASHFHFDYGKHGRTWNYRICE